MEHSGQEEQLFYLHDYKQLSERLKNWSSERIPFLIGVTYALLDFSEAFPVDMSKGIVMETGGMKGRKKEMTRAEVHGHLKKSLGVEEVHSEYGMTELLSQAYSTGGGVFMSPDSQKILVRDPYDPMAVLKSGQGYINVVDLANIYSCSFIATDDIGLLNPDGSFEVKGRRDFSALRGCSLLSIT